MRSPTWRVWAAAPSACGSATPTRPRWRTRRGDIITTAVAKDVNGNALNDATNDVGSTFADAANLGSFTYAPIP